VPGACHTDCMSYDFWVTDVSLTVIPPFRIIPCLVPTDVTFVISADITTSAAGTVTYRWKKCVGTICQVFDFVDLVYTEAGTQTDTMTWFLPGVNLGPGQVYDLWTQIYILIPNNQSFPDIHFSIEASAGC